MPIDTGHIVQSNSLLPKINSAIQQKPTSGSPAQLEKTQVFGNRKEQIESWVHFETFRPTLHTWVLWIYLHVLPGWVGGHQVYCRSRCSVPSMKTHYIHLISCSITKGIPLYICEQLEKYICKGRFLKRKV